MAAEVQGTAHIFGIAGAITNLTIQGIVGSSGFELNQTTEDQTGVTVETRRDNRKLSLTINARMKAAYTMPVIGDAVTIADLQSPFNSTYELVRIGQTYANADYLDIELELEKYEGVSVS
jgi:hypothetical protein